MKDLSTLSRRLRHLRRYPNPCSGCGGDQYKLGMAHAYEYALRVVLSEFQLTGDDWAAHMYGPQNEDPDLQAPL